MQTNMKKILFPALLSALLLSACNHPSHMETYRAQKHVRDSVALLEQQRSILFYQSQLEELTPKADSLLPFFKYEKNEKYQDHGWYVATGSQGHLRVLVSDEGTGEVIGYYDGKRLEKEKLRTADAKYFTRTDKEMIGRAYHLAVVMADIKELELRIRKTSLEIQKYEKRLEKQ